VHNPYDDEDEHDDEDDYNYDHPSLNPYQYFSSLILAQIHHYQNGLIILSMIS
jgi:hypothetical protein